MSPACLTLLNKLGKLDRDVAMHYWNDGSLVSDYDWFHFKKMVHKTIPMDVIKKSNMNGNIDYDILYDYIRDNLDLVRLKLL